MTIVYVVGSQEHIEDFLKKVWCLYLKDFKAKHPNAKTEIEADHYDDETCKTYDCEILLAADGKTHHSSRFGTYSKHPDSNIDKCLLEYDDLEEGKEFSAAFYYNPTSRLANGAHASLADYTREEIEAQGFYPKNEGEEWPY